MFGIVLVTVGLFYILLALAPRYAAWVVPAALVLGGGWLGFLDGSGGRKAGFLWLKRLVGAGAVVAGAVMVSGLMARGIEFRPATEADLRAALAAGRPVMIDFSADWCVPCHELENFTFTDRRVIGEARAFRTFKVDLTWPGYL